MENERLFSMKERLFWIRKHRITKKVISRRQEKLQAIFSIQGKTIYHQNQAMRLFLMKQGLFWCRMKWKVFQRVNMNQEKYARNFPSSRNNRIGAQRRQNANTAKQKESIKLLLRLETSYPFQPSYLIRLQDLIRKIIQKNVSGLSLLSIRRV